MAKREKFQKTNAMRELERAGVSFTYQEFEEDDLTRGLGLRMALEAGVDPASSFKTLVTVAPSGTYVVCCIPVAGAGSPCVFPPMTSRRLPALCSWTSAERRPGERYAGLEAEAHGYRREAACAQCTKCSEKRFHGR